MIGPGILRCFRSDATGRESSAQGEIPGGLALAPHLEESNRKENRGADQDPAISPQTFKDALSKLVAEMRTNRVAEQLESWSSGARARRQRRAALEELERSMNRILKDLATAQGEGFEDSKLRDFVKRAARQTFAQFLMLGGRLSGEAQTAVSEAIAGGGEAARKLEVTAGNQLLMLLRQNEETFRRFQLLCKHITPFRRSGARQSLPQEQVTRACVEEYVADELADLLIGRMGGSDSSQRSDPYEGLSVTILEKRIGRNRFIDLRREVV